MTGKSRPDISVKGVSLTGGRAIPIVGGSDRERQRFAKGHKAARDAGSPYGVFSRPGPSGYVEIVGYWQDKGLFGRTRREAALGLLPGEFNLADLVSGILRLQPLIELRSIRRDPEIDAVQISVELFEQLPSPTKKRKREWIVPAGALAAVFLWAISNAEEKTGKEIAAPQAAVEEKAAPKPQAAVEEQAAPKPKDPSVENAFRVCAALDHSGILSEKCSVSGWNSSIDISVDMNPTDARKVCTEVVSKFGDQGLLFTSRWTLRIYSPFSGERTIAVCNLG